MRILLLFVRAIIGLTLARWQGQSLAQRAHQASRP